MSLPHNRIKININLKRIRPPPEIPKIFDLEIILTGGIYHDTL
jgi:hypothetical protein